MSEPKKMYKKCQRCKVVYHSEERTRCLYCNSLLLSTSKDDTLSFEDNSGMEGFQVDQPVLKQFLEDRNISEHGRTLFILGSYFRSRTFHFMYSFSRHQYLRGKTYPRTLVQPLALTSFLMMPWVAFDLFDSLMIRASYNAYCEKCKSKFKKFTGNQEHDHEECLYNREYNAIIDDIISGRILVTEDEYKRQSVTKLAANKKSAYLDLCGGKDFFSGLLDVTCIWFSVCLIIIILVWMFFPMAFVSIYNLGGAQSL